MAQSSANPGGASYATTQPKVGKQHRTRVRKAKVRRAKPRVKVPTPRQLAAAQPIAASQAQTGQANALLETSTGGQMYGVPNPAFTPTVPGLVAKILPNGLAAAPTGAPVAVQQAIWAANKIVGLPYVYGGGHQSFQASGYDCSGTVSYALHGGNLLDSPLDSSSFMHWGLHGAGQWITVYTNPGHAYAIIAGIRLDTSSAGDPSGLSGPRWRPVMRSSRGFTSRHLSGL